MRHTRAARLGGLLGLLAGLGCDGSAAPETDMRTAREPRSTDPELLERWQSAPIFHSGRRLRARSLTGGGDAATFTGFRDSELNVPCGFALADDGEYRCLPEVADGRVRYRDAQCTEPVYEPYWKPQGDECSHATGAFVTDYAGPDQACGEAFRRRVYRVGSALPAGGLYDFGDVGCEPVSVADCPYEVAPVPAEEFERGEFRAEPSDHGIGIEWLEYDDGARVIGRLRDSARDASCGPMPSLFDDRCVPSDQAHAFGDIFSNEGCTGSMVALDFSREPCTDSSVVIVWNANECSVYQPRAFELGSVLSHAFVSTTAGCESYAAPLDQPFYAIGKALTAPELPPLRHARIGRARLVVRYYASLDGQPLLFETEPFYDTKLATPCHPEPFADGTRRCVPAWKQIGDVNQRGPFVDAECTERVVPMLRSTNGCGEDPELVRVHSDEPDLSLEDVYTIGESVSAGTELYYHAGGKCRELTPDPSNKYHRFGKRLDLAVLREVVD